jgi:hypothetical protein
MSKSNLSIFKISFLDYVAILDYWGLEMDSLSTNISIHPPFISVNSLATYNKTCINKNFHSSAII